MNKKLRISLLCLVPVVALLSCRQVTAPEYIDVNNVQVSGKSLTNTTLSANVRLYNPNNSNLIFRSGNLDIYVDNRLLGHTELDSTIYISKLDTFQIPVNVQVDINNVIGNALSLAMKDSVLLRIEGKIRIGRSGVFITRPVRYEQKERLDLF
ncbi:LEA type 2 family protein [Agriterribacter sp.]|uniref:LEA type 2 family protein n=1 Tax=Agriterribacter sp. TaxID=2821509 RepID=UPI002C3FDF04|nr:LEA type 2 family protein [Agriterribacter sp.]HRO48437.1 LEA type 2 family protein [Agriterribacter sp.]HRQ18442.1 LEA type 2 family protein [Agriterribacter sp.]